MPVAIRMLAVAVLLFSWTASARDVKEIVGVAHVGGKYEFNLNEDYLNEGANEIAALGSRVIKVWLHWNGTAFYPDAFNPPGQKWCPDGTDSCLPFRSGETYGQQLVWIASHPHYQQLFQNQNFNTYVLVIRQAGDVEPVSTPNDPGWWFDGLDSYEFGVEKDAMYQVAKYLMQTYPTKTFILQNHEGDHWLRAKKVWKNDRWEYETSAQDPTITTLNGMVDWLNARQQGVEQARAELGRPAVGATALHAAEVNHVSLSIENPGAITMTRNILPSPYHQRCDLYSYSAYDANNLAWKILRNLEFLAGQAKDSPQLGNYNIYIGEYGAPENEVGGDSNQRAQTDEATRAFLGWGVQYAIYWQVYDNEGCDGCPSDSDFKGYWIRRRSGTYPSVRAFFTELLQFGVHHVGFISANGYYVSANDGGGAALVVDKPHFLGWEHFAILDRNGGTLVSGDPVNVLANNGRLWMAGGMGGGTLDATSNNNDTWERFTILKQGSGGTLPGPIYPNDFVALRTWDGTHYVVAEGGGGPGEIMNANRTAIGPWETFRLPYWQ